MKSKFIQKVNSFFNSSSKPNKNVASQNKQVSQAKVISFGNNDKPKSALEEQEEMQLDEIDTRYSKLQQFQSLKNYGLRNDEIEFGEVPVFFQPKLIFLKTQNQKYDDVTVIVTNYKLCLQHAQQNFFFIVLGKIEKLQRYTENQTVYKMLIECKDGRKFKFRISSQGCWRKFYERLQIFSFIRKKNHFFAYKYFQEGGQKIQQEFRGWNLYQPLAQFKRMGIPIMENQETNSSQITADFKILDNKEGKICTTYPPFLIVPSRMSNDSLIRCAKFRSRQRMPALTYCYEFDKGKFSCVFRSSQSKVGVKNSRSTDDELMLRHIGNQNSSLKEQKQVKNCIIYDARNYYAALGNRIAGKGYQSQDFYTNCKIEFLNIPNIHAVRDSYNKMIEASSADQSKFYLNVAESKWYQFIFLILAGALDLANKLLSGKNALVHCSDGWDRTSQLCSLGALYLDPFYRTIKGFLILIEKDWIHFGHQFRKRLSQGINDPSSEDKSQVFLQFLDCVTQIINQFPNQFEFEYKLISDIADQAYSHLYGNFLCNNYLQMQKFGIMNRTVSLWSKILKNEQYYLNPYYKPELKTLEKFDPHQRNLRIWKQYFLQYHNVEKDVYGIYSFKYTYENMETMYKNIKQEILLLEERSNENKQILSQLQKQISIYKGEEMPVCQNSVNKVENQEEEIEENSVEKIQEQIEQKLEQKKLEQIINFNIQVEKQNEEEKQMIEKNEDETILSKQRQEKQSEILDHKISSNIQNDKELEHNQHNATEQYSIKEQNVVNDNQRSNQPQNQDEIINERGQQEQEKQQQIQQKSLEQEQEEQEQEEKQQKQQLVVQKVYSPQQYQGHEIDLQTIEKTKEEEQ